MAEDVDHSGSDKVERSGSAPGAGADLLRREYDECLGALADIRREEAALAARKVQLVARCAGVARAMAAPGVSLQEQAALEMAFVAEVACALTVSEPAAGTAWPGSRLICRPIPRRGSGNGPSPRPGHAGPRRGPDAHPAPGR
jgi:hypothetical protein